jgi:Ca2+-binding EF-hand superfamily protein
VLAQPSLVFQLLDKDGDGLITASDLLFFLRKASLAWRR